MKNLMKQQTNTFKTFKLYSTVILFFLFGVYGFSQDLSHSEKGGILAFDTEVIDYGTVDKEANGIRNFTFTNTGESPVVISKVKTSCGCTVPTYPKGSIMPGEAASISIKYDTGRVGKFSKTITVFSNASTPQLPLTIKGNVIVPSKS